MRTASFVLSIVLVPLASAEWNQWRGPNRDGKSAESGLLAAWPESGPEQVWMIESLGTGNSSSAAANGTLFTQGVKEGKQYLIALDAKTGETEHGKRYSNRPGDGPRGTPIVDGDRVFALGGDGNLICEPHDVLLPHQSFS